MTNPTEKNVDWSNLYQYRRATQKRYKTIWHVPLKKRHHQVVRELATNTSSLLELGAGSRNFYDVISPHFPNLLYIIFDVFTMNHHDFYSLEEITGEFDTVCMFEVIEHVPPKLALETLTTAFNHMKSGGMIFVSTPNTFNPPEYLRDATHITPWCYDELGGVLQLAGFELKAVYRLYHDSLLKKILRRFVLQPLFRAMGIDFSKQIIAVGIKP